MFNINNHFITLALFIATVLQEAHGHGQLSKPYPRGGIGEHLQKAQVWNEKSGPGTRFGASGKFSDKGIRCHDNTGYLPRNQWTTLTAGEKFTFELDFKAAHPGDCNLYVSVPGYEDMRNPSKWYKIYEFPGCGSKGRNWSNNRQKVKKTITLPKGMPKCDHCVLRWEWAAVHMTGDTQFYASCSDIIVKNNIDYKLKPSSIVTVDRGIKHLNYKYHRNPYKNDNWPENGHFGPALAHFENTAELEAQKKAEEEKKRKEEEEKKRKEEEEKKRKEEEEKKRKEEEEKKKQEEDRKKQEDEEKKREEASAAAVSLYKNCEDITPVSLSIGSYTKSQLLAKIPSLTMLKVEKGYMVTMFSEDNFKGKYSITMNESDSVCYDELLAKSHIESIIISKFM
eukprot:Pgem_evm1s19997